MADRKPLTFAIMDAPYEDARSTTALRLIDICARRGYNINVFAYEGAVYLPFAQQEAHPNAVNCHDAEEEDHPLPKEWVAAAIKEAEKNGGKLDWVNLCVVERGAQALGERMFGLAEIGPGHSVLDVAKGALAPDTGQFALG